MDKPNRSALVMGGTGFVGRHVCEKLCREGWHVTVPTRRVAQARHIQHLPGLTTLEADVHDAATLEQLVRGHDAVIQLIAILHGSEPAFEKVHVALPGKLAQACQATGVRRVIHVSALGVSPEGPALYQKTKARGESALAEAGLDLTVLRPSVIFGAEDSFLNLFAAMQKWLPFVPLASAQARFQPVWVEDVASAAVAALQQPSTIGKVYECAGPDDMSLAEIVRFAGAASGHRRPVFGIPAFAGRMQAWVMEQLPGTPLMSRDNLDAMKRPNVATGEHPGLLALGIVPASIRALATSYLGSGPDKAQQRRQR
ncbi:complex I NDUFA9 subunit family protein [Hydrogenophaga sp. 5NK40-0174]|uniref:complex I NDUFA9 subunit family protein n=1 Tax=Hydrogenophaga sp. 5NK40-0174 TaxID=3127649 RepID=UPI00310BBA55